MLFDRKPLFRSNKRPETPAPDDASGDYSGAYEDDFNDSHLGNDAVVVPTMEDSHDDEVMSFDCVLSLPCFKCFAMIECFRRGTCRFELKMHRVAHMWSVL